MRARRIIEGAAFGPDVVRTASAAFVAAWAEIEERFQDIRDVARERLAQAIITATRDDSTDMELLRRAGLQALARAYPQRMAPPPRDEANGTED